MSKKTVLSSAFAATIFLSAFLLFLVQPLISKIILPWFGGSTGVWATCLVFFQSMLCLGYAYAHFLQRLPIRTQRWCHWILLGLGIACLPVMPSEAWKPLDGNDPTFKIFLILLLKTGIPYLALSATGPLLQAWHARLYPESRTYRLYALSNVASLSSLLLFPLWFERAMTSNSLSLFWSLLFVGFVLFCGYVAYQVSISPSSALTGMSEHSLSDVGQTRVNPPAPLPMNFLLWLFLPAFASFLLLAGTNHLCQDIASTPFLWILPLCLYLLSFILCFDAPRWYAPRFYVVMGLIGLYGVIALRELGDSDLLNEGWLANAIVPLAAPLLDALDWYAPSVPGTTTWVAWLESQVLRTTLKIDLIGQIGLHCMALFAIFMVCHGELARRKPPLQYLTAFYLMISIGGAIGSALVSLVAPLVFPAIWEWLFGLAMSVVFFCGLLFHWRLRDPDANGYWLRYWCFVIPALVVVGLVVWQNSRLPLDMSTLAKGSVAKVEKEKSESEAIDSEMTEEVSTEEESETEAENSSIRYLLPSSLASLGWILLAGLAVLGAFALGRQAAAMQWIRPIVVNVTALALVGFYLHDVYKFAPEDIFKKKQKQNEFDVKETDAWRGRSFYGALSIMQSDDPNFPEQSKRTLQHGRIIHGTQFIDESGRSQPTTYYAKTSGVGLAIEHVSQRDPVRIGAIGLGTGTLAAYAAPQWNMNSIDRQSNLSRPRYELTIYEINPLVVTLSEGDKPWFNYLNDARTRGAKVEIVLGDARLMMERQEDCHYDVLAVDAFSGDSIPIHLLTDEAMQVYQRHLQPDGVLAIHISNRYLDLEPICKGLADKYGFQARTVEASGNTSDDAYTSTWVLLTNDVSLTSLLDDSYTHVRKLSVKPGILWTDAYSSLYEALMVEHVDDAIDAVTDSYWYQLQCATRPDLELKSQPKFWRDGWTYLTTWPVRDDPGLNHHLRYKDSQLEVRPANDPSRAWQEVE